MQGLSEKKIRINYVDCNDISGTGVEQTVVSVNYKFPNISSIYIPYVFSRQPFTSDKQG